MRSDTIKTGFEKAPHRSLLKATGTIKEKGDYRKPFIGICNSFNELIPGHAHLQELGRIAKEEVRKAGGVPFEFNTIGVCDGIAMGHIGMRYSLASRELIADSVETVAEAHRLDGLVCIPNCDKITPGMMMAALRINIPVIFVSGGPMKAGCTPSGKTVDLISVFEAVGQHSTGEISEQELESIEENACPGCGSCSGMFTANSMNCLSEALGFALPGNGTILAVDPRRNELVREASRQIITLVKNNVRPRDILSREALLNAFALDFAMGGSTNTILHTLAIANEAELDFDFSELNALSARTPYICKVSPATMAVHIEDVDRAGGISAILHELSKVEGLLDLSVPTVTGHTLGENIADAEVKDRSVIRSVEDPYSATGGLCVLYGNLAPRLSHQNRCSQRTHDEAHRPGQGVRLPGRCNKRHYGRRGQIRRCRRHPLRRTKRRPRYARNALPHQRHHGPRTRRFSCPYYRRKVFWRIKRSLHRSHFTRSS